MKNDGIRCFHGSKSYNMKRYVGGVDNHLHPRLPFKHLNK
jgi:hypothetical protein